MFRPTHYAQVRMIPVPGASWLQGGVRPWTRRDTLPIGVLHHDRARQAPVNGSHQEPEAVRNGPAGPDNPLPERGVSLHSNMAVRSTMTFGWM